MRIKKIVWKDFTKNPIFTKDDMWVQGDLNTNILELEVDSNFIGKEVQLITGKAGSIDAVVYRQIISELNTFVIENTAVKSGNFNIFLRVLDGDNLLVSEAVKYEVKEGVCFSRISIPKKDEDWLEQVLADLKETAEKAVVANSELENTIADSVEKNELLKVTIEKAEVTDKKLGITIIDSVEKNLELKKTIADSVNKKEALETSISESVEKNSELDSTISSAVEENSELNKTISDSVAKKEALDGSIADSVNKKEALDGSIQIADVKVAEMELVAKEKLEDINDTSDSRIDEINKVADDRIEEVKVSGGAVNKLDNQTFEFWLGTTTDYDAIVEKSRGVLYQHFDEDGNFAGGYYKKLLTSVTRGLVDWFEFADGKGTETTLKSRVSDNVLTLTNFNFDANSGWTGKGLKFDGVDDYCILTLPEAPLCIEISFRLVEGYSGTTWRRILSASDSVTLAYRPASKSVILANGSDYTVLEPYDPQLNYVINTTNLNYTRYKLNGLYSQVRDMAILTMHSIKIYNTALTPEEIAQNYEYEQSIDRTTASTYPMLQEELGYGIGLSNQLSEEQKSTFRLSLDGNKFVAGLRYCEGLEVVGFTYSDIQKEMEKEEWRGEADE